jgi:polyadenylate-binding protein
MELFVTKLDPSVSSEDLSAQFSKYGNVINAAVCTEQNGKSKGFGFVKFDSEDSVEKAIKDLNENLRDGKTLFVKKVNPGNSIF